MAGKGVTHVIFRDNERAAEVTVATARGDRNQWQVSDLLCPQPIRGMVGVGTWDTQAQFKELRVSKGGKTLFASTRFHIRGVGLSPGVRNVATHFRSG